MSFLTAREALTYAVSREMVQIYIIIGVGILLQGFAGTLFFPPPFPNLVNDLVRLVFSVIGFIATFIGSVALLFKLIADGTSQD